MQSDYGLSVSLAAQFALANGLRVFLLEDHELPVVQGSLIMRGGQRASPPDKASLRPLTWLKLQGGSFYVSLANSLQGSTCHLHVHSPCAAAQIWHFSRQQHLLSIQCHCLTHFPACSCDAHPQHGPTDMMPGAVVHVVCWACYSRPCPLRGTS